MEVKLVTPQKSLPKPAKTSQPPSKPVIKRKIKTKINKKPATLKKEKITTKESPLARRKSVPKKKPAPTSSKLTEIKERLARQKDDEKLHDIRQRLRQEASPEAKALQASLTQTYQMQLKAWLMRNWHLPEHLINSGLEATINLTIDAQGKLLAQTEEELSDNPIFNHAMHQAIINATPFPAFPKELNIPQEEFVITFSPNNLKQ
jgi:outer membrane biosynthesis protein TonB